MKAKTFLMCAVVGILMAGNAFAACPAPAQAAVDAKKEVARSSAKQRYKLGLVLTQTDPETVFNAFRLAQYSLEAGDDVSVFLLGKGVDLEKIKDSKFDVREKARSFCEAGGKILACGTCLRMRGSEGTALCPVSTLKDLYNLIRRSDRVLTF